MRKLILLFTICTSPVFAQVNVRDSLIRFPLLLINYSFQQPAGDMAQRYGQNNSIGAAILYKNKHNLIYGAEGNFLFGNKIKESSLFNSLVNSDGFIIDDNGNEAVIDAYERGYQIMGNLGKILPIFSPNKNSGFVIIGKAGYMRHKIRIETPDANPLAALSGDYKNGYDRLTDGITFSETIGYMYFGNKRLINFFIGVESMQGFTQTKRFNYDTMSYDKKKRNDILNGIRIGWILPLYKKVPNDFYYY